MITHAWCKIENAPPSVVNWLWYARKLMVGAPLGAAGAQDPALLEKVKAGWGKSWEDGDVGWVFINIGPNDGLPLATCLLGNEPGGTDVADLEAMLQHLARDTGTGPYLLEWCEQRQEDTETPSGGWAWVGARTTEWHTSADPRELWLLEILGGVTLHRDLRDVAARLHRVLEGDAALLTMFTPSLFTALEMSPDFVASACCSRGLAVRIFKVLVE